MSKKNYTVFDIRPAGMSADNMLVILFLGGGLSALGIIWGMRKFWQWLHGPSAGTIASWLLLALIVSNVVWFFIANQSWKLGKALSDIVISAQDKGAERTVKLATHTTSSVMRGMRHAATAPLVQIEQAPLPMIDVVDSRS